MHLKKFGLPLYQSHRGYHQNKCFIENTFEALKESKRLGYDGAEMDLQLSADNQVILHHDKTLARIYKDNTFVSKLTSKEIKKFEITTLESVLKSKELPLFLNLELKNTQFNNFKLEIAVAETIRATKFHKNILFSSFNPLSLMKLAHLLPMVPRALLVSFEKEPGNPFYLRRLWFEKFVDFQFLNLDYRSFRRQHLYFFRKKGIGINLWTLNDLPMAEHFLKIGVSSIITDKIIPSFSKKESIDEN